MTDAQRVKIRTYLGYSDQSRGYYSRLEGAIDVLIAEAEEEIICLLEDLATIETTLKASQKRQKVMQAEDVKLAGHDEIIALWKEGSRYVRRISTILGVEIKENPFSSGSPTGVAGRG